MTTAKNGLVLTASARLTSMVMLTLAVFVLAGFAWFPMFICGCHFHPEAFFISLIPLAWSLVLLGTYRRTPERVLAWAAFGLAVLFLWHAMKSNGNPVLYLQDAGWWPR